MNDLDNLVATLGQGVNLSVHTVSQVFYFGENFLSSRYNNLDAVYPMPLFYFKIE